MIYQAFSDTDRPQSRICFKVAVLRRMINFSAEHFKFSFSAKFVIQLLEKKLRLLSFDHDRKKSRNLSIVRKNCEFFSLLRKKMWNMTNSYGKESSNFPTGFTEKSAKLANRWRRKITQFINRQTLRFVIW